MTKNNDNNNRCTSSSVRNNTVIDNSTSRNINNNINENFIQVQEQYFSQYMYNRPTNYITHIFDKSTFFIKCITGSLNRYNKYECDNTNNLYYCDRNSNTMIRSVSSPYHRCWYFEKQLLATIKQHNFMCHLLLLYIILLLLLPPIVVHGFSTIYVFDNNHYHPTEQIRVQKLSVGSKQHLSSIAQITYLSSLPPRQQRIEWYDDGEIDDDDNDKYNAENYNSYYEDDDDNDNSIIKSSMMIPSENEMKQESISSRRISNNYDEDDNSNLQTAMSNMFRVKTTSSSKKKNTYYSLQELEEYVQQISSSTTTKKSTNSNNNDNNSKNKDDNNDNGTTYYDTDDNVNENDDDDSLLLSEDMYLNAERMLLEDGSIDFTNNLPMSSSSSSSSSSKQPKWRDNDNDDNKQNNRNDYRTIVKNRLQVSIDTDQDQDINNNNDINNNQSILFPQLVSKNAKTSTRGQVNDNDVDEQVIDSIVTLWNQFQQLSLKTTSGPLTIDDDDDDDENDDNYSNNNNQESVVMQHPIETSKTKKYLLTKKGQQLHENIFQNENGYLQQSNIFRQSLTNTSKVYDAITSRRIKQYTQRQEHSIQQLQYQLHEMEQLLLQQNRTKMKTPNSATDRISSSAVVSVQSTSMLRNIQPLTSNNNNRQYLDDIDNEGASSVSKSDQNDANDVTIDGTNPQSQIHTSTCCSTCGCRMSKEEMEWNMHQIKSKQLQRQQKNSNDDDDKNDNDDKNDYDDDDEHDFNFIHQYICHICHSKNLLSANYQQQQQDTYSRYGLLPSAKKNIRKYRTATASSSVSSSSAITGTNNRMLSPRQLGIKINFDNSLD